MSETLAVATTLCVVVVGVAFVAWGYRRQAFKWRARSQHWFEVAMGSKPAISEDGAAKLMRDLFPRPLDAVPSTALDVVRQREWRERRALYSRDHYTTHFAEGAVASEWATEVLMLTVGTGEVDR